jgi:hypothetical protein
MNKGAGSREHAHTQKLPQLEFNDRYNSNDNRNESEVRLLKNSGNNYHSGDEE